MDLVGINTSGLVGIKLTPWTLTPRSGKLGQGAATTGGCGGAWLLSTSPITKGGRTMTPRAYFNTAERDVRSGRSDYRRGP